MNPAPLVTSIFIVARTSQTFAAAMHSILFTQTLNKTKKGLIL